MSQHIAKKTSNDPLIGTRLGDYEIVDIIGQGGMGRVYKGFDSNLERYAAVKVFDPLGSSADDRAEYQARFQREARSIARLRHPNIVDVYQFGQADSLYYMAMVMVEGRDLRAVLKKHATRREPIAPRKMLRILSDVASALDYAHSEGVIHRDIKPSNIMVMDDNHAILTDFGLALSVPEGTIGTTFGSAHYIAPEQAMSSALAVPQSDFYSLGIILYEMLTGRVPFNDESAMSVALKHISDPPPSPRLHNPDISPELELMVLRALEKEPENRFSNGEAMIRALENVLGIVDEGELTREVVIPESVSALAKPSAGKGPDADTNSTVVPPKVAAEPVSETGSTASAVIPEAAQKPTTLKWIAAGGAALLVVALVLFALAQGGGDHPAGVSDVTSTREGGTVVAVVDETEEATTEPTATRPRPTTAATATEQPPTATPEMTATAAVPVGSSDEPIKLIYDENTLVLLNQSDDVIDISGLTFVQVVNDGANLTFSTRRWNGGTASINALPAGDCFQVWTTEITEQPVPDGCNARHKWDQASFPRWFWISDKPNAEFEVRHSGEVIATCQIEDGECLVDAG